MMIDFHTHSLLSDGVLLACELARRAEAKGYSWIAVTDHVDMVNAGRVAEEISAAASALKNHVKIRIIPGVEITHIPPLLIESTARAARAAGAAIVLVHGETCAEPVCPGTNRAAVEAGIDILAHPGLIDDETASLAAKNGVILEISARKGHSLSNGHVVKTAGKAGAALSFGSDAHTPDDLGGLQHARNVLLGAGLSPGEIECVFNNMIKRAEKYG